MKKIYLIGSLFCIGSVQAMQVGFNEREIGQTNNVERYQETKRIVVDDYSAKPTDIFGPEEREDDEIGEFSSVLFDAMPIVSDHPIVSDERNCECGFESSTPKIMRNHKAKPHDLDLKCGGCDSHFISKWSLNDHTRKMGHSRRQLLAAKRKREGYEKNK